MPVLTFLQILKVRLKIRLEYRASFLFGMIGQMLGYLANYLIIWLLLTRFKTIAGWSWSEIALLYSLNLFTYAIAASFTWSQTALEQSINDGEFDNYLIRPLHPFIYYVAHGFNFNYIAHILLSSTVLFWAFSKVAIEWSILKIIFLFLVMISGTLLQASAFIVLGSWSFISLRSQSTFQLYFRLREFISYPLPIYGIFIQLLLTVLLPMAFINYYPSLYLLDKSANLFWLPWLAPLIGALSFFLSLKVWMMGVRKYQSVGG